MAKCLEDSDMEKAKWSGKMEQNLKEIGIMVMPMAMEFLNSLMEIFTGGSGSIINVMAMAHLLI